MSGRRVVWKFGGTSVGDPQRLRAVARRLVAAHRQGLQVVAVLSAMGHTTDDLLRSAYDLSAQPQPRELDALLSVGETMSCALAAIAVHELGESAVSFTGPQAGVLTDAAHGNARLCEVNPTRIVDALDGGAIALVTGYQGASAEGDVTTLGRGGSDASAIAVAAALGLSECDIFTDVPGVFTADPRVVGTARQLTELSHTDMLHLAEAGAQVLQPRAVELAAAHDVDIHVRSAFTHDDGTWIRQERSMFESTTIAGVAHRRDDPVYTVRDLSAASVSSALARRGVAVGAIIRDDDRVRFTAPGAAPSEVLAAFDDLGVLVAVRGDLGSVSVVSAGAGNRPEITSRMLDALHGCGIDPCLVTSVPGRVCCHLPRALVEQATRALHDAFELSHAVELAGHAV